MESAVGRLSYYEGAEGEACLRGRPLLLIHGINAAASAYEMRPLYEHYRRRRPVFAIDLPGFGFSERRDRTYMPPAMTEALEQMIGRIRYRHGAIAVDAVASSLSCEFLARVAAAMRESFRSLALISPTGFGRPASGPRPAGTTRARPFLRNLLRAPFWSHTLFGLLVTRPAIRHSLRKTWGMRSIDEALVDYCWHTAHQPAARHAPYCYLAGFLASQDIDQVYASLRLPVWVVHGRRGEIAHSRHPHAFVGRSNWCSETMSSGSMPHFECPGEFIRRYEAFLERLPATCTRVRDAMRAAEQSYQFAEGLLGTDRFELR